MKKTSSISKFKDKDIQHLRQVQLDIIRGGTLCPECKKKFDIKVLQKDVIEASKLLSRLHHALQPDKIATAKAVATQSQEQAKLTKAEQELIDSLINGIPQQNGTTQHTGDQKIM